MLTQSAERDVKITGLSIFLRFIKVLRMIILLGLSWFAAVLSLIVSTSKLIDIGFTAKESLQVPFWLSGNFLSYACLFLISLTFLFVTFRQRFWLAAFGVPKMASSLLANSREKANVGGAIEKGLLEENSDVPITEREITEKLIQEIQLLLDQKLKDLSRTHEEPSSP